MPDTKQLGAQLGEKFAGLRASGSIQEREAKLLIDEIISRDPKVKLPSILDDEQVKAWQKENAVTDGQLKAALTAARSELKGKAVVNAVKVPPRARRRVAQPTVNELQSADRSLPAPMIIHDVVPNLPLDQI